MHPKVGCTVRVVMSEGWVRGRGVGGTHLFLASVRLTIDHTHPFRDGEGDRLRRERTANPCAGGVRGNRV